MSGRLNYYSFVILLVGGNMKVRIMEAMPHFATRIVLFQITRIILLSEVDESHLNW